MKGDTLVILAGEDHFGSTTPILSSPARAFISRGGVGDSARPPYYDNLKRNIYTSVRATLLASDS